MSQDGTRVASSRFPEENGPLRETVHERRARVPLEIAHRHLNAATPHHFNYACKLLILRCLYSDELFRYTLAMTLLCRWRMLSVVLHFGVIFAPLIGKLPLAVAHAIPAVTVRAPSASGERS